MKLEGEGEVVSAFSLSRMHFFLAPSLDSQTWPSVRLLPSSSAQPTVKMRFRPSPVRQAFERC